MNKIVQPLKEFVQQNPKLFREYVGEIEVDDGWVVVVPRGVILNNVIEVEGEGLFLVIVQPEAECTIEENRKEGNGQTFLFAEKGSRVKYVGRKERQGNWDVRIEEKEHAEVKALLMLSGEGEVKLSGQMKGRWAKIEQDVILTGDAEQKTRVQSELRHCAPDTEGYMEQRGILRDRARCDLRGLIRVDEEAVRTKTQLVDRVLLLSEKARCDAVPALDIRTDDVQCSHSASVRQADKEQVFYMMSRGLDEQSARELIVEGFFEGLITRFCGDGESDRLRLSVVKDS